MAITSRHLTTTGAEVVYTSSGTNAIVTIIVCNTGDADPALVDETVNYCDLTLHICAFGETPQLKNTVVKNLVVPAGETIFFSDEKIVLDNGDSIRAIASNGNLLSITVSTLPV